MIVYRIFCKVTGKSYIGATTQTLKARMSRHVVRAARMTPEIDARNGQGRDRMNYPLYVDVRKYGWEAFDVTVLGRPRCSVDELAELETAAIKMYRSLVPTGYNQIAEHADKMRYLVGQNFAKGGMKKGSSHTAATKAKMSAQRRGALNPAARVFEYRDVVYSTMQECAVALGMSREQLYGELKRGTAKFLTPARPGTYGPPKGFRHTDEAKQRMSEQRRLHHPRRRPILLDGKAYVSLASAVGVSGYSLDQIKKKLKRGQATYLDALPAREQ